MLRTCTMGLVVGFSLCSAAEAAVLFVKPIPTGAGNCGSWADACALTDAINSAESGDEVWVRAGVYGPIGLKDGVRIIGGFAGNETSASQSNPLANVTALDGGGTSTVVTGLDNPPSTVLRGFHIRNGYAEEGGGMYLNNSSPTIVQCVFEYNQASFFGAALSIDSFSYDEYWRPKLVNCEFRHNGVGEGDEALPYGGGAVFARTGAVTFANCLFHHNKAWEGGVLLVYEGILDFFNCTMVNNTAEIGYAGAIFDPDGRAFLFNCIIWLNRTTRGVGLYDDIYTGSGGTTRTRYCDVRGWSGTGNIDADPLFENSAADDYRLQPGSPCIGTANNAYLPADVADLDWDGDTFETIPMDLGLLPRILGTGVDMGPYEVPFCGDGNCEADENSCNCSQDCGPAAQTEQVDSTCNDGVDNDCDTFTDCADPDCGMDLACMGTVPTVSAWGLVILTLLLLTAAKIYFGHQPARRTILQHTD